MRYTEGMEGTEGGEGKSEGLKGQEAEARWRGGGGQGSLNVSNLVTGVQACPGPENYSQTPQPGPAFLAAPGSDSAAPSGNEWNIPESPLLYAVKAAPGHIHAEVTAACRHDAILNKSRSVGP